MSVSVVEQKQGRVVGVWAFCFLNWEVSCDVGTSHRRCASWCSVFLSYANAKFT
jgi:hypothetical protein